MADFTYRLNYCFFMRHERKDNRSRYSNEFGLTVRQMDVLKQLAEGKSNKDIGLAIGLAENTVKLHVSAIFVNLKVNKRAEQ